MVLGVGKLQRMRAKLMKTGKAELGGSRSRSNKRRHRTDLMEAVVSERSLAHSSPKCGQGERELRAALRVERSSLMRNASKIADYFEFVLEELCGRFT